jgi:hypothetical protein
MQPTVSRNPTLASLPNLTMTPKTAMQNAASLAARGVYAPPYPWDVPPPGHIARHIMGSIAAPAYGISNQVLITQYRVPANMFLVIAGILFRYDGSGFVSGSGNVVFTMDVDNPTTGVGTGYTVGHSVPDYGQILFNLGSFDFGVFPLASRPMFQPNNLISMKGYTVAIVGTGAPNQLSAMFVGWEWPVSQ